MQLNFEVFKLLFFCWQWCIGLMFFEKTERSDQQTDILLDKHYASQRAQAENSLCSQLLLLRGIFFRTASVDRSFWLSNCISGHRVPCRCHLWPHWGSWHKWNSIPRVMRFVVNSDLFWRRAYIQVQHHMILLTFYFRYEILKWILKCNPKGPVVNRDVLMFYYICIQGKASLHFFLVGWMGYKNMKKNFYTREMSMLGACFWKWKILKIWTRKWFSARTFFSKINNF